ncbi:hypothetical protein BAAZ0010004c01_00005 [Bifidobacterium phage BadAztec4]|nr:hypothetical protein BAAZ0010004c01_00005 [Bifidobacterium phage BadAztec4]
MDKRLAGLPPREQARFRKADLYSDDPWNNARVTRAFRRHRKEMNFAAWNKGFQGNDILFADSVKNLLRIYSDNKSADQYLRHSICGASELCLSLPDSTYWANIFDYPVQMTDIFGNLRVQWFIGYYAVCSACGCDSYDMIQDGCNVVVVVVLDDFVAHDTITFRLLLLVVGLGIVGRLLIVLVGNDPVVAERSVLEVLGIRHGGKLTMEFNRDRHETFPLACRAILDPVHILVATLYDMLNSFRGIVLTKLIPRDLGILPQALNHHYHLSLIRHRTFQCRL